MPVRAIIATKNQGKIEGAKRALAKYFDDVLVSGISVPSYVSEQPVNDEIALGAKNRVKNLKEHCKKAGIKADLYLAIESGINNYFGSWMITNVAVIEDNESFQSCAASPSFPVPDKLVDDVIKTDLSRVMDSIFKKDDQRHNYGGGIQLLTKNKLSRVDMTEYAFIMALTKYLNTNWN